MKILFNSGVVLLLSGILLVTGCGREEQDAVPAKKARITFRKSERTLARKPTTEPTALPLATQSPETTTTPPSFSLHIAPTNASVVLTQRGRIVYQTNGIPLDGFKPDVVAGEYQMIISAPGYDILKDSLSVSPRKGSVYITLIRLKGALSVKSNAGVTVLVTNEMGDILLQDITTAYGTLEATLPQGNYSLQLQREDYYPATKDITISPSQIMVVNKKLRAIPSRLWIASTQPAEVWEGNRKLGTTETTLTNLDAGDHTFILKSPGFKSEQLTATLPPNSYTPLEAPVFTPAAGAVLVSVTSSVPNDIFFNNLEKTITLSPKNCKRMSKMILFRDVQCGYTEVTVEVDGYAMKRPSIPIKVQDDETNQLTIVMVPAPAQVDLLLSPANARILENGKPLRSDGNRLLFAPFIQHELTISHPDCADRTLTIPALNPATTTNFFVILDRQVKLEDLIVNSEPQYPSVRNMAPGSQPAQLRQKRTIEETGLPLEVQTAKSGITFRLIPSGRFRMGSPIGEMGHSKDEEQPLTNEEDGELRVPVRITSPFYVSSTEVTRKQWKTVTGNDPAVMKGAEEDAPVESVNWDECQTFLDNLCRLEGVPAGTYRLLTEAEWEYCCRAGTQAPTYIGDCAILGERNSPDLDRIAIYSGNSGVDYDEGWSSIEWPEKQYPHRKAGTQPVAQKQPNAYGLYDMIGSVWEWTADLYVSGYPAGPLTDPQGPDHGNARVCRGGAWSTKATRCRAAERYQNSPLYRDSNLGLRIARELPAY